MATYFIRWAFKCTDVPYRRHMVHSTDAANLVEAAVKAQERAEDLGNNYELISIHDRSEIVEVISQPRFDKRVKI